MRHTLELITHGNFNGRVGSRVTISSAGGYDLFDPDGRHVASCSSPKPLATHAFNGGAISIHHDYDLIEAEKL